MKRAMVAGFAVFIAGAAVLAQDWPQWRGPSRDGKVEGFKAPSSWPKELAQKWQVKVGSGDSTPALAGGKLYVFARDGGDEVTICLNADTKEEIWRDKFAVPAIPPPSGRAHAGPRASPAVADGKVVTVGVTGVVSCLAANKSEKQVLWRNESYKSVPKFYTAASPLISGDVVITYLGGEGSGALVALNMADGSEKWKWPDEGPGYASPVMAELGGVKQIVTLTEKSIIGVSAADGKLLWQVPFVASGMNYNAATPIIDGQTVICTGAGRGTKALKIEKQGDKFQATELWANKEVGDQFSSQVLKDGLLFGVSDKGNIYCLSAKDEGKTAWTDAVKYGRGYGAMVDAGTVIMALPDTGPLVVFKPDAKAYAEVIKYKVSDTPSTYATPVISGGKIFIKDQDNLTCWSLE
jgi:outer membrane protein assembly factor BamB